MKTSPILFLLAVAPMVYCLAPVPENEVGYVYRAGSPYAPVRLDAYMDEVCIDSKKSWPVILSVADHYGPQRLQLVVHLFALPYLGNGFIAHKGTLIINEKLGLNATFAWIDRLFDDFDNLNVQATKDLSYDEITEKFSLHAQAMGVSAAEFNTRFAASDIESSARVEWKHAATRGIYATPTFMLNDVMVSENENTNIDDWKTKIDKVLSSS